MNILTNLQEAYVDDCNKVYLDKIIVDTSSGNREIVLVSLIGYGNVINDINRKFTINKNFFALNIRYGIRANNNTNKKYKVVTKKKDANFSHTIIYLDDFFKLYDNNEENYTSYLYLNKSEGDCEEELENALYDKLDKYSSVPILRDWIPYLKDKLIEHSQLELMSCYGIEDNLTVYKLSCDKRVIKSFVCRGLSDNEISVEGTNAESVLLDSCDNLNDYLNLFGESLAKKIQEKFKPKFVPGTDKYHHYTNVIDDYVFLNSGNELYEAQKTAIQSIVNNWLVSNNTILVGEMGTGN